MLNYARQIISTLMAHRLRNLLALLSIVVGILSVLVLVALGEGFYQVNMRDFADATNESLNIYPGTTSKIWQNRPSGRTIKFTEFDAQALAALPAVNFASAVFENYGARITTRTGQRLSASVIGIQRDFQQKKFFNLVPGSRTFNAHDMQQLQSVAIIGHLVAENAQLKVGEHLLIEQQPFTIIGILAPSSDEYAGADSDEQIFIPSTSFLLHWHQDPNYLTITPNALYSAENLDASVRVTLARLKNFDPGDRSAVYLAIYDSNKKFITLLLRGIQLFLGFCGAMTLAVGSLGVANILFLSVTERTREIGLRMAVGATPGNIWRQFVAEGFILISMGAGTGVALSYLAVAGLTSVGLPTWLGEPRISIASIWIVLSITLLLALMVVSFPARRAARMTPVAALTAR